MCYGIFVPDEPLVYPSTAVQEILGRLQSGITSSLGENLEGLYLKGSLALGDFNPETSDIDLLVAVKQALGQADFERLDKMHRQIQTLPALAHNRYSHEIELAYLTFDDINGFQPGEKYISLERGEQLKWKTLGSNWLLEFWTVREHGVVLFGPEPKAMIDPISTEQIVVAVRGVLPDWLEWVETWDDPAWQSHMGEMRFAVETLCRVLYTLDCGEVSSKPVAVRWALGHLEEPWHSLIQESQTWRAGEQVNLEAVSRIADFVRWTGEKAG